MCSCMEYGLVGLWCGLREHIRGREFDWCASDGWLMGRGDGWGNGERGDRGYILENGRLIGFVQ